MKGYVRSRIRSTTDKDADDILQDVALKLFSNKNLQLPIGNVGGFVYRSIRNKIIDIIRKKEQPLLDEDITNLHFEFTNELAEPRYPEEMFQDMEAAIMELKPHYREIIIAIDIEGYSYKEISEETGIPQGTLMARRHRAIAQLYKELENKLEK